MMNSQEVSAQQNKFFHGPKDVGAIAARLYLDHFLMLSLSFSLGFIFSFIWCIFITQRPVHFVDDFYLIYTAFVISSQLFEDLQQMFILLFLISYV